MERSSMLKDRALELAHRGFKVFPCRPNEKIPAVKNWNVVATSDESKVKSWFMNDFNIAIHADELDGKNLVVIDVDTKKDYNGFDTLSSLGIELPDTYSVSTPSGGKHFYFLSDEEFANGTKVLGKGIDVRARNGYVMAPGSSIDGVEYTVDRNVSILDLPDDIKYLLKKKVEYSRDYVIQDSEINSDYAKQRFIDYLSAHKEAVSEGERTTEAYKRACKGKDFGLEAPSTLEVMEEFFHTSPPMDTSDLIHAVRSAYQYGKSPIGFDAPEKVFETLPLDLDKNYLHQMNKEYAVLFEGKDIWYLREFFKDGKRVDYKLYGPNAFKIYMANKLLEVDGGKKISILKQWLEWKGRREYTEMVCDPSNTCSKTIFNTWMGFEQEIKDPKDFDAVEKYSVELFDNHLKENISNNDHSFYLWITGYLANIIQHPTKKYPNAAILKGEKGTGKSLLIDIMREVLGSKHVVSVSDLNSVVGDFNSVVADKLLINIDEAYWAGNKSVDAPIKHLISTEYLTIKEKYRQERIVRWYGRVISTTNDEHAAIVTQEERRYSIKTVNPEAKYLKALLEKTAEVCKSKKGANAIFNYLRTWDLSQTNLKTACVTKELIEQKTLNLDPVHQAWYCFLMDEKLGNIVWTDGEEISFTQMSLEIISHIRIHFPRTFKYPSHDRIGRQLHNLCPSLKSERRALGKSRERVKILPSLDQARREFAAFLNTDSVDWGDDLEDHI